MLCPELEMLEKKQIEVRVTLSNRSLTEAQRDSLINRERSVIMDIAEHKSCGHDGDRCFGE
jgi:hypothetical protein